MLVTLATALAIQALPTAAWCSPAVVEREAWVMGTRLRVVAEASSDGAALQSAEVVMAEVERLDGLLSTWSPDSEMAGLNRATIGEAVSLSVELHGLLAEAFMWADATGGAFNPGVGPYVDAWDLRGAGRVPPDAKLRRAGAAARLDAWHLDDQGARAVRRDSAAWIDTGAFGKGAALRSAAGLLADAADHGDRFLADLGGQVWARATREEPWTVAVAHPGERSTPAMWLSLYDDVSAATSGTSERFVEVGGVRYGHILDARTGWPAPAWGTVTVVHPDPMVADILATALYVMGPDDGLRWLDHRPEIPALFLDARGNELRARWTRSMEHWLDPSGVPSGRPS